jgi:hypothetical protein
MIITIQGMCSFAGPLQYGKKHWQALKFREKLD